MRFMKLQALRNDFLVVETEELGAEADLAETARRLCDRHTGAGADGMIVVRFDAHGADCATRIFNADGSEAEVSGNGTRCVAAWLEHGGRWPAGSDGVAILTGAGLKRVRRAGGFYEMEMGAPGLASSEVPMRVREPLDRVVGYPLEVGGRTLVVTATSMGNPHCSVLLDDLGSVDFRELGASIERHELFPERTNVEFVECVDAARVRVLFWERGVGETMSSGTGAAAAAVAAVLNGRVGRRVTVETPAGELSVRWREEDGVVLLTGPAEPVFAGAWLGPRGGVSTHTGMGRISDKDTKVT